MSNHEEEVEVWVFWDCDDCGHKGISCEYKECPECGEPRTFAEFDDQYLGEDDEISYVEETPDKDEPNWHCVACHCDNSPDVVTCYRCDAPRRATSVDLDRGVGTYNTFQAHMDGDQGATADLVEQFGEYAGMRAATGRSFNMDDDHEGQLQRAAEDMDKGPDTRSRPQWEESDLPSSVQSMNRTHPKREKPKPFDLSPIVLLIGGFLLIGLLFGLAISSCGGKKVVEGEITEVGWSRSMTLETWEPTSKSDWRHNITNDNSSPLPLTVRQESKPRKGVGERAGIRILSCEDKYYKTEKYVCGEKEVPCSHSVVVGQESYDCSYPDTESYSCTKERTVYDTERYSCTKQRTVPTTKPCTKYKTKTKTKTESCTKYRTKKVPDLSRCRTTGRGSRKCKTKTKRTPYSSTCNKQVTERVPYQSTCSSTKNESYQGTCTKEVPRQESYIGTCTRPIIVPKTCYRDEYGPAHDHDIVDRYCDRDIYKSYCTYETQHWVRRGIQEVSGKGNDPTWPIDRITDNERFEKSESYWVEATYLEDGKQQVWKKSLRDSSEYDTYRKAKDLSLLLSDSWGKDSVNGHCLCTVEKYEAKVGRK